MSATLSYEARCRPQGTCPKPWVAMVGGEVLRDRRKGWRRFSTEAAAIKAAKAAACEAGQ